jgi:ABC-2 type transport system ATP-binding protein
MNASPVIRVEGLTKHYGTARGVENLAFSVQPGEIFGFLGPNGAGKTTTIRLLLDLLRPSSGTVHIFGQSVRARSREIRGRLGYLPGNFSAYDPMTGEEFLRFAASMRGAEPRLQAALTERFGLAGEYLARRIKHLSHGTRQKLGIVQAFFHRPELVVLDEPTNGLDPLMQDEFYRLLAEVQRDGRTVFFSSHNLPEVEKVCQRIAIIREGSLVALDTLEGLRKKKFKRLSLTLREPVNDLELPGARCIAREGNRYDFLVNGELPPLLEQLARLPVTDMALPEPDLEEVFMAYYRRED